MANFKQALNLILKHEGGYVNNPRDRGGETYQGIARNFHSSWAGWAVLDQIANKKWNAIYRELDQHVSAFYHAEFWDKYKLGGIKNQDVSNLVFDWLVNSGKAGREIQRVLNSMGQNVTVDNYVGTQTVQAINNVDSISLINNITQARIDYYKSGVENGWLDSSFLKGLLARANSFSVEVADAVGKPQQLPQRV